MRIIRTEAYFDLGLSSSQQHENPGVAFAFFRGNSDAFPFDLLPIVESVNPGQNINIRAFLEVALLGGSYDGPGYRLAGSVNPSIIDALLKTEIVLESSPPFTEQFEKLANKAPIAVVGTYVAANLPADPLLLLTVPTGILLVGAAVAISRAFERGLNRLIDQHLPPIKPKPKRSRPKAAKKKKVMAARRRRN
jgi:hypothetical protein